MALISLVGSKFLLTIIIEAFVLYTHGSYFLLAKNVIDPLVDSSILFNESISTEESPSISPFNISAISIALNFIACKIREFQ